MKKYMPSLEGLKQDIEFLKNNVKAIEAIIDPKLSSTTETSRFTYSNEGR